MKPLEYHLLQAYLDSELTAAEATAVEARLDTCPTSRQRLDQLRLRANTTRTLLQTPDVAIPAFAKPSLEKQAGINEAMGTKPNNQDLKPGKPFHVRVTPWILALAACLTGALWLLQPFKQPSETEERTPTSLYFYQEPSEVDANRPYTEQTTDIQLISQDIH